MEAIFIIIARAILDLGISYTELNKAENAGIKHRNTLVNEFLNDKSKYLKRINNLLKEANNYEADIILLPAYTILYENENDLSEYKRIFKKVKWVIAGALEINKDIHKESAIIFNYDKEIERINSEYPLAINLSDINSRVAISSTIKEIRDGVVKNSKIKPKNKKEEIIYGFDLGHEQYTGRYKKTLKSIANVLFDESVNGSCVILSFWKYINSSSSYNWFESKGDINTKYNRNRIKNKNSNIIDFLDVISILTKEESYMPKPELIDNIQQVKENMKRFKKSIENKNTDIVQKLSQFRRWYYSQDLDMFAPSKFIGYKSMQAEQYNNIYNKIDGRETEEILKKISKELDEEREEELLLELEDRLNIFDKSINKRASVRVID